MSTTHDLKVWAPFWPDLASNVKTFEVRINDRDFHVGDKLRLREWESGEYTGREIKREITYVLHADDCPTDAIADGFVVLAIVKGLTW